MAKRKLSQQQYDDRNYSREVSVAKSDKMIQNSRFALSVQEQKCVLYAISKIKPEDKVFKEYTFDIKDFYDLCGLANESYTELKAMLKGLRDRSWWMVIDDKGTESAVSWFSTVRTNQRSGKVTIKFHEDMMPFLLNLVVRAKEDETFFFTKYGLKYILPMRSQYSPRLYEILKSYQKNNKDWYFSLDEIRMHLNCQNYKRWVDLKRFALDPAVKEINEYSDLNVRLIPIKEGRKYVYVKFLMAEKSEEALAETSVKIYKTLDGPLPGQTTMDEYAQEVERQFRKENPPRRRKRDSEGF